MNNTFGGEAFAVVEDGEAVVGVVYWLPADGCFYFYGEAAEFDGIGCNGDYAHRHFWDGRVVGVAVVGFHYVAVTGSETETVATGGVFVYDDYANGATAFCGFCDSINQCLVI